jgi:prepilin-type processing-associated H-X9-DG protein
VNFANTSTNLIATKKSSGRVSGKSVCNISVNAAYADGHFESHKKQFIKAVYDSDSRSVWFY